MSFARASMDFFFYFPCNFRFLDFESTTDKISCLNSSKQENLADLSDLRFMIAHGSPSYRIL
jgi:UDP-2,3-diacylglucosamine pyrophosphatase LpxH